MHRSGTILLSLFAVIHIGVCADVKDVADIVPASKKRVVSYEDLLGIVDLGVMELDESRGIAISPDGQYAAAETRWNLIPENRVKIAWRVIPLRDSEKAIAMGDGGERISETSYGLDNGYSQPQIPIWSADSRWVVYRAKRNGEIQLWRSRKDDGKQEQLTHNAADVEEYRFSNDGQKLLFSVGRTRTELRNAHKDEGDRGYFYDGRFSPLYGSKEPFLTKEYSTAASAAWLVDWSSGVERVATVAEAGEFADILTPKVPGRPDARWVRQSRAGGIAWLGDQRVDRELDVAPPLTLASSFYPDGRDATICPHEVCIGVFKGIWISDNGHDIYFERWDRGVHFGTLGFYRWRVTDGSIREVFRTNDVIEACSYVPEKLICARESPTVPRALIALDLQTGEARRLYDPNPHFRRLQWGEVTELNWRDRNGIEGFGHLVKPVGYEKGRRYPLVIVQYISRGFLRGGVGDEYPIHVLAAKGLMVLSFHHPDDRDVQRTSRTWDEVEVRRWADLSDRRRTLSVLEAGIDALDKAGLVDPSRVGISGLSAGAELASFALIHSPRKFAAAAISGTVWNPMAFYLAGPTMQARFQSWGLGFPDENAGDDGWNGISLARNAAHIATPLLIHVSDAELLAETQTFSAFRHFGRPIEMYVFPNEYHIKSQPRHRQSIYRRNVQWFQFWLRGLEESDPLDGAQYQRWKNLRTQHETAFIQNSAR